jgi:hypothetical protein
MDWQQLASLAIVGVAAALMLRSRFHRPRLQLARTSACPGCAAGSGLSRPPSVVFHTRKGERPQIIIKAR